MVTQRTRRASVGIGTVACTKELGIDATVAARSVGTSIDLYIEVKLGIGGRFGIASGDHGGSVGLIVSRGDGIAIMQIERGYAGAGQIVSVNECQLYPVLLRRRGRRA